MNRDEKFRQRMDWRRNEFDGESWTEISLGNGRVIDIPGCHHHQDKADACNDIREADDEQQNLSVKGSGRKRSLDNECLVMLEDLKVFSDSLIHQLNVARENMFEDMRQEMEKMAACRSNLKPSKKKMSFSNPQNGIETSLQLPNFSVCKPHLSQHKPLSQSHMIRNPFNDRIPAQAQAPRSNSGLGTEFATFMNGGYFRHQAGRFHPQEQYRNMLGSLGRNWSQTASTCIGSPLPLLHTDNGSNTAFLNNNSGAGLNFNAATPALSGCVFPISASSNAPCKADGEFVAVRPQDLRNGQVYLTSSRKHP